MRRTAFIIALLGFALSLQPAAAPAQPRTPGDGTHSFVWPNGDSFTGVFRDGKPNGPGTFRTAAGQVHEGEWHDGCLASSRGYRLALFTRLSDCPRAKPRKAPLPRIDMR
ncbi:MAG: hypothetical protein KF889_18310 [Alphaproteobacteria bacterium]|nr:hypothetical protein [Alphaproteobacteria bacterium]MCW5743979.1 hypothetical protein [Alphaproteobacteria bacterium]